MKTDLEILTDWRKTTTAQFSIIENWQMGVLLDFAKHYYRIKNNGSTNIESKRFLAIGTLANGKSFRYVDTAYDFLAFTEFIRNLYPAFDIDSITEV